MKTHQSKSKTTKKNTHSVSNKSSATAATFQFVDKRPEIGMQATLQEMANQSKESSIQRNAKMQPPINNTGLPDALKAGIEKLSGYNMDDVKVHRNSDKPAQLEAHAYAQGTAIHLGPGQEKHLPHEAWHVVQQKQGRVQPTMQMKGNININDNDGLEKEADVMGAKALNSINLNDTQPIQTKLVVQLGKKNKKKKKDASKRTAPEREGARNARFSAKNEATTTFNNNEKKLPRAPKGTKYIETDVGSGRTNRGKKRVVSLVENGTGRTLKQYNTDDHYSSFR